MKRILIIGAGEMQVPIIEKCNNMGIETLVTDFSSNAPGLQIALKPFIVDTLDKIANLKIAIDNEIDGVITTSELPVNTLAYICDYLGLPGLSVEAAGICTNKYLQRRILNDNGINTTRFFKTSNLEQAKKEVANFSTPLVIKPIDSSASRGVAKVENVDALEDAFNAAILNSKSKEVIIEEYISGNEYSVESLTQNGETHIIAITEKSTIQNSRYFVEERHIIPASLTNEVKLKIEHYIKSVIKIFGIDNAASHAEIKLNEDGPFLIEIGARLGGDYITSDLVPLATNVDMQKNIVLIALGEKIEIDNRCSKFAGIQFIHKYNYEKAVKVKEECSFFKMDIKPYKDIEVKSSLDRLGYFIFQEESRAELDEKLNF